MEQNIRLLKNQIKNIKKKVAQELRKREKQESESSLFSQGKVITGTVEPSKQKQQFQEELQETILKMQAKIYRYEETIFNQREQIQELMNCIDDQITNSSYQIISSLKTNWQRKNNSESSHNKISIILKKMVIKKAPLTLEKEQNQRKESVNSNVIQRLEKQKASYSAKVQFAIKNKENTADFAPQIFTY